MVGCSQKNNKKTLKFHQHKDTILDAEDKFGHVRDNTVSPKNLTQLGELAIQFLNDKNLEVSKVRPFFWTLVETYVDRFQLYPFDVKKVLFSYLELNDYPEDTVLELVKQLESRFEKSHGRALGKPARPGPQLDTLDDDTKGLRDSLRYAAKVAENSE
jgi:hypothetical protein